MHFNEIFTYMTAISIFISCLGLFGFSISVTGQRSKEIGIRKVLGASLMEILRLISGDFIKLVLIASVISFPLSWWAMHAWLQDFAYRVAISWWVFLLSGLLSVVIAVITISFQVVKAAVANPVITLKAE
jgi:putative ABC transport system permease protein